MSVLDTNCTHSTGKAGFCPAIGDLVAQGRLGDVADALAEPSLSALLGVGAPVLVATAPDCRVIFANVTACYLFGTRDAGQLQARVFAGQNPAGRRLTKLATTLEPNLAARLERLRFFFGTSAETLTVLCRSVMAASGQQVFVFAAMGVRAALLRPLPASAPPATAIAPETMPAIAEITLVSPPALPSTQPKPVRFAWRSDVMGKLTEIGAAFLQELALNARDVLGQTWAELAHRHGFDAAALIGVADEGQPSWSGLEIIWPRVGGGIPIKLGAAPVVNQDKRFDGYRGFGLMRLDQRRADVLPLHGAFDVSQTQEPVESPILAEVMAPEYRPLPIVAPLIVTEDAKVVRLHPLLVIVPPSAPEIVAPIAVTVQEPASQSLSPVERSAFREIGRKLGADVADAPEIATDIPRKVDDYIEPEAASAVSDAVSILQRLPVGVLVSRDGEPLFINQVLLDVLGYLDANSFRISHGMQRMFKGRQPEAIDPSPEGGALPLVALDGEIVMAEARMQAIEWGGQPATLITFRRAPDSEGAPRLRSLEMDVRQREAEARELRAILDTATDGVVVLDDGGRILSLNRSAEALFGYDQNEVAGDGLAVLIAKDSQSAALDYMEGLRSNGVASVLNDGREIMGRARQGGAIPIFMTLGRIGTAADPKFCAVLRDLTQWKKAERELGDARQVAERASALKSDFLAKISHEIRTPLNAILGFAEVIIEERFGAIGNDRYKDYMKDIHASGAHVMSLVNDLLDLSKIEAGKMELEFASVDANAIVAECVSLMQPEAARERVIMRQSLAPRLPNVVADARALKQIVLNLLSNAVKFNETGGQVIISTALTDAGHAVIRIRDTGIGMSDADVQTALEPFRQLQTTRKRSGTGLGLPLTKALVEANRASFTIKSKKNEGTLVEVAFPPTRVLAE